MTYKQKQPFFDGSISGLGFVILSILIFVLPQILIIVLPSLFIGNSKVPYLIEGGFAISSLIIGLVVGLKAKYKPLLSGLLTGFLTLIFVEFALIPFPKVGFESFFQYSMIILLPVLIGTFIGSKFNKSKHL